MSSNRYDDYVQQPAGNYCFPTPQEMTGVFYAREKGIHAD
jgi:hypothetical protein